MGDYRRAYCGFIDYSFFYHKVDTFWKVIGVIIFFGTIISFIPQITTIIERRSNFGLSSIAIWVSSFQQFILVANLISLHPYDFVGLVQIPFSQCWGKLLSFGSVFILWFSYHFITYLNTVFFDQASRERRPSETIYGERKRNITFIVVVASSLIGVLTIIVLIGIREGFNSDQLINYGGALGTLSSMLVYIQYLPQMITTIKFQDPGSLSLLTIIIQAPGGIFNTCFMIFGNHDHWTTWISFLAATVQQLILLVIVLYYTCKKKPKMDMSTSPLLTT